MTCSPPFQKISNVGCVHLYVKHKHSHAEGLGHCQSLGGELFEFDDFDLQYEDVFYYLIASGGKSVLVVAILSHPTHLSTASIDNEFKSDIGIGLRKAKNGNYYWQISGNQVEHREEKNIWEEGQPHGSGDCVHMNLFRAKHVKNSFRDYPCTRSYDISFCQIPFLVYIS